MDLNNPLWLVVAAFGLGLFPIAFGVVTAYLKISIVLGLLRSGLQSQQVPSNLVIMAVSAAITIFVMAPVIKASSDKFSQLDSKKFVASPSASSIAALAPVAEPWLAFMREHSGERELLALRTIDGAKVEDNSKGQKKDEVSFHILVTAFVLTELKEAFAMGFVLLLPFLVIDLIVGNVLVGLGMQMVSPALISLPLKLILFVISDGWLLISKGLIESYKLGGLNV
jgi:type III secretory pathway component EscR